MSDNVTLNPGIGGAVIAADEIAGTKYQRVKLIHGDDGVNDGDISSTNPLPVVGDVAITGTVPVSIAAMPSTPVTGTFWQATQPVSGPLTNAQLRADSVIVKYDDAILDSFSRVKVSNATTLFDAQQEYGLDTRTTWDASANGTIATPSANGSAINGSNAVGPTNLNSGMTPITVSSTNTHYAILQSGQYVRYIPGKAHNIYVTGVFAAGANYSASINLRTSTSGSPVLVTALQNDWNVDKMDGFGKCPVAIDFTKIQIMVIDAQMLYAGRVRVGFDIAGKLYWAHYFEVANNQSMATMKTFNLPVRLEGRTGATTTDFDIGYFDSGNGIFLRTSRTTLGGTIQFECCSVQSEGGSEPRGYPHSSPAGISSIAVTGRRPVLSIRPKATFNGITNRAHIEEVNFALRTLTQDALFEIVVGGALTNASWLSVSANSATEYDVSATAISGGESILKGFAMSGGGTGQNQVASLTSDKADLRNPLVLRQIDAAIINQTNISIVCTPFSATSNITPIFNWHEQTN